MHCLLKILNFHARHALLPPGPAVAKVSDDKDYASSGCSASIAPAPLQQDYEVFLEEIEFVTAEPVFTALEAACVSLGLSK